MELADRRVAGGAHLGVRAGVLGPDAGGVCRVRLAEHRLPPRPEVAALAAAAQPALERVRVRVDEPGQGEEVGHGLIVTGTTGIRVESDRPSGAGEFPAGAGPGLSFS